MVMRSVWVQERSPRKSTKNTKVFSGGLFTGGFDERRMTEKSRQFERTIFVNFVFFVVKNQDSAFPSVRNLRP